MDKHIHEKKDVPIACTNNCRNKVSVLLPTQQFLQAKSIAVEYQQPHDAHGAQSNGTTSANPKIEKNFYLSRPDLEPRNPPLPGKLRATQELKRIIGEAFSLFRCVCEVPHPS